MAKRTTLILTCDLPHEDPAKGEILTIQFGYEGKTYEVELCKEHLDEYHLWMQDYVTHGARVVSAGRSQAKAPAAGARAAGKARSANKGVDTATARVWALENGLTKSTRGRLSAEILQAYAEATK